MFKAMDAKYRFRSQACSRRYHYLCAYAASDDELQVACPQVIIDAFEKLYMVDRRWDPYARRNVTIERRLLGFRGARQWVNGTLVFSIRSPEIPFFGAEASRLCPGIPIMYRSTSENVGTRCCFFLEGKELTEQKIPATHQARFAKLIELRSGYIPGRLTIDSFFDEVGAT